MANLAMADIFAMLLTVRLYIEVKMSNFKFIETFIKDVYIIETKTYVDNRGYFLETYKKEDFEEAGLKYDFIQENQSMSRKGVLRGLHYQKKFPQTKLVRVVTGEVFDVAVDLRKDSSTYGKWFGVVLSEQNKLQLLIPKGFAHGFLVLSEQAVFAYKCDELYHPEDEKGLRFDDPRLSIDWPFNDALRISDKDLLLPFFDELNH